VDGLKQASLKLDIRTCGSYSIDSTNFIQKSGLKGQEVLESGSSGKVF
jgi:hypothetical protein